MTAVKDRLENGEWVMSPLGELVRKPVSIRDAHVVAKDNLDNAIRLESEQSDDKSNERIEDRLDQLAERLLALSQNYADRGVGCHSSKNGKRDYKKEANWEKTTHPARAKQRAERMVARREMQKRGRYPERQQNGGPQERTHPGKGRTQKANLRVVSTTNLHKEGLRKRMAEV